MSYAQHPLSESEVNDELVKMQNFIKKEAEEKAKEIRLKADQEYEIEKQNLVQKEILILDEQNANKLKKQSLENQIVKSTVNNKMRLKLLESKNQILNDIFETALTGIKTINGNKKQYTEILKNLILEALYKILELSFIIKLREEDVSLIKPILKDIETEYLQKTGLPKVELIISDNEFLVPENVGGVIVANKENKISVDNTFEERLQLLRQESLPAIRTVLDL
ncbi:ATPase, V1/A1 complex, subunit E [Hanseniaspora valbyensis NRRL Y-1626]|uniref:ATPase, V1/A1 complex, subunit E n=1 Tax=Hanseniaspora valbyensis NRRL Y-1626 TaxID=766949 RepID=A0A1B7TB36_9ASCO|nr:ATPase, V1/A1 complex, subunit E [Hanseniaspora valbyensis NRRL Y-1626]